MIKKYDIKPVPKPRMTQADRWKKRPPVLRYFDFKDECKKAGVELPNFEYWIVFVMPMAKSWSKDKKRNSVGQPMQQRPDKDNLEKALLDAVMEEDCAVWDGRVSKIWGVEGAIYIGSVNENVVFHATSEQMNKFNLTLSKKNTCKV